MVITLYNAISLNKRERTQTATVFQPNWFLLFNTASLAEKKQLPVFGLTRPALKSMIYFNRFEHANHYSSTDTDAAMMDLLYFSISTKVIFNVQIHNASYDIYILVYIYIYMCVYTLFPVTV